MKRIENLRYECEASLENMPEQLQETSDSGIMLQERIDALYEWYNELEGIDTEPNESDDQIEYDEWLEDRLSEIKACEVSL